MVSRPAVVILRKIVLFPPRYASTPHKSTEASAKLMVISDCKSRRCAEMIREQRPCAWSCILNRLLYMMQKSVSKIGLNNSGGSIDNNSPAMRSASAANVDVPIRHDLQWLRWLFIGTFSSGAIEPNSR